MENVKIKKKKRYINSKKFSVLGKNSGLIPLASNPGIGTWYSRLCGEVCHLSCQIVWDRQLKGYFPLSLVL
jgi:hypothetical protein